MNSSGGNRQSSPIPSVRSGIAASGADNLTNHLTQRSSDPLTSAFARRQFVVPWQGCVPVAEQDVDQTVARLFQTPRVGAAVAYVHVPYCQNHCLFCGFFQNVWRPDASAEFVNDVVAELSRLSATPLVSSAPIDAIYIGGGTPSALAADDLARLVKALRHYLPVTTDCEITVEGRVYDFGIEKAISALDAGANRISLGIQSFDTELRRRLGRKVNGADARSFLAELVALDRATIGCDLIYGLPGQDHSIWRKDIETAIDLGLDGVSIYALNVWPQGPLAKAIGNGKLAPAGPLPFQAQAYSTASELFTASNWRQISQAHFAGSPREHNRYNSRIKAGADCLPFGPGAGGHAHGYRWKNVVDIKRRAALVEHGKMPIDGLARVPRDHRARAAITAGLETGLLDVMAIESEAPGFANAAATLLEDWSKAGLGRIEAGLFRTNRAGAFWISNLTNGLLAALDALQSDQPALKETPA
jgi:oxygen-independent coproporphyrinogen-3 oxidase